MGTQGVGVKIRTRTGHYQRIFRMRAMLIEMPKSPHSSAFFPVDVMLFYRLEAVERKEWHLA